MKLRDWMLVNRVDDVALCEKLDISRGFLSGILNRRIRAGPKTARRIQEVTNGEITKEEVLNKEAMGDADKIPVSVELLCKECRKRFLQVKI